MKYLLIVVSVLILTTCSRTFPPPAPLMVTHDAPRIALQFHGDVDFTYRERALIAQAIADLEYQTAGLYRLGITYDLDFQAGADRWDGAPWLVRAESSYPWIALYEWSMNGQILGLTMRDDEHRVHPPRCYLVIDRLGNPNKLRHVAMHELLHAAWLDDVVAVGNVMSGRSSGNGPLPVCLTSVDRREFCRALGCKVEELNGCDP